MAAIPPSTRPSSGLPSYDGIPPISDRAGTLTDRVRDALLDAIILGDLRPGTHLKADALSRHYGVSIIPVREALRALEAHDWVTIRPHQGAFVRHGSQEELDDINEMRAMLEVGAARMAAQRSAGADLRALRAIAADGAERAEGMDLREFSLHNAAFHDAVAAASGNRVLHDIQCQLSQRVRFYTKAIPPERIVASVEEHAAIAEAIEDGDVTAAEKLAVTHHQQSLRSISDLLP